MFRTSLLASRRSVNRHTMSLTRPFTTTLPTLTSDQMPVRRVGKVSVEKDPNEIDAGAQPSPGTKSGSGEQQVQSSGHPTGDPKDSPSAKSPSAGQPKGKGGVEPGPPR